MPIETAIFEDQLMRSVIVSLIYCVIMTQAVACDYVQAHNEQHICHEYDAVFGWVIMFVGVMTCLYWKGFVIQKSAYKK